jgi:hypothetical protein
MKISTDELRRATLTLLRHVEENGQKDLEIEEDFYWEIPAEKRYAPYDEPTGLTMGQLSDDWSEVMRMVNGEREVIGYGLVWLASVLRRVGERVVG